MLRAEAGRWKTDDASWYAISFLGHALVVLALGIVNMLGMPLGRPAKAVQGSTVSLKPVDEIPAAAPKFEHIDVGETPLEPTELNTETLQLQPYQRPAQTAQYNDDSDVFRASGGGLEEVLDGPALGGLGGFSIDHRPGPGGRGGVGVSRGHSNKPGTGGTGEGFGGRGSGHREALAGGFGGTRASERAVAAALNWLQRHQATTGSWSLQHQRRCTYNVACSGQGQIIDDMAATALGLLPFLGAGQTHESNGPYKQVITNALFWLLKRQTPDGDLSGGSQNRMYSHAIATIAVCEAFGMTHDVRLQAPAEAAVRFIEQAQNETTGGWRYQPGAADGDTSVTGWQMMALKSAQMAGVPARASVVHSVRNWLQKVARGDHHGLFAYQPSWESTPTMTAVGMLCNQYLGMTRDDPAMIESKNFLLTHLPDNQLFRSTYYWYYATLAMHNCLGTDWDTWNRKVRRALVESQSRDGCSAGSWDPERPSVDDRGHQGGRLMMTSLGALTLEVYYRYLPLFKPDMPGAAPAPGQPAGSKALIGVE